MDLRRNKLYKVKNVLPGMVLGQALLTEDGKMALSEGTILSPALIERLKTWGLTDLEIYAAVSDDNIIQPDFSDEYDATIGAISQVFQSARYFNEIPLPQMRELANTSIAQMVDRVGVLNQLQMVQRYDDYTIHHSINVAAISGVIGKWMGYEGTGLQDLILSGLLHDIGKARIPLEILNKPGKLSIDEMALMRNHATHGYQLVRNIPDVSHEVAFGVLQHHERMDGSGYPMGMTGDRIYEQAKIIAVADVYDAMTSDRVYRKKVTPFIVAEFLSKAMFDQYDPTITTLFLHNVQDYFLGNIVELNDGQQAEVVYLGQFVSARPVVRTEAGEFIDLEKNKACSIIQVVKA